MELWTFKRYRRPELHVDAIEHEANVLTVRSGPHAYHIGFDHADAAAEVAEQLATLRHADSPLWDIVRRSESASAWFEVAAFLDRHSLIRESEAEGTSALKGQVERISKLVEDNVAHLIARCSHVPAVELRATAVRLRSRLTAWRSMDPEYQVDQFDADMEPNFYEALFALEIEYLRRASPGSLSAVESLLRGVENPADQPAVRGLGDFAHVGSLYDERDLAAHLWLVATCVVRSFESDAHRFPTPPLPDHQTICGLEFMRQTELVARSALKSWGENAYVGAIKRLTGPHPALVAGPFIEQYHVTRRFVEIIAPLLSKRLTPRVRSLLFQYYAEEVGHEALESTTCEALGVSEIDLERALPLPLHFAFVDVLTLLAHEDPIASFAAIMAIEGVFGEPPKMSLRLASVDVSNARFSQVVGDHEELNEDLNHNSIPRDIFEHIRAVSPETQRRVLKRILFLLELNHRAWAQIAEYYGCQSALKLQGPLGASLLPSGLGANGVA